jgi:serine/threonine-protein kinase
MVFGTPHYMSPEQAQGNPIDHRADIYAMGVILFECLTGRVPFEDDTYMGVLTKHMFETPPRIETVVPDVELGALGPIVVRCLSKNAHDRYADMIELADALDAYLKDPKSAAADAVGVQRGSMRLRDNEPFEQGRVSLPVEGPPMASRAPVFVALGVGLLVGLGVLAFSHFRSAQSAAPESSSATVTTASPTAAAIASAQPTASATPSASTPPTPTSSLSATVSASAAPPPTSTGPRHAPTVKRPPASRPPQSGGDIVNPWGTR